MITDKSFVSRYTFRNLPWVSKSTIGTFKFCRRLFEDTYILKKRPMVKQTAKDGINMHLVVSKFFDVIDYKKLLELEIRSDIPLRESNIFYFIIRTLRDMLPQGAVNYKPYRQILTNFAIAEADNYTKIYIKYSGEADKILKYYPPVAREQYREHKPTMTFGTTDRINIEEENHIKYKYIMDYKTGNVPIDVKRGLVDKDNMLSCVLPSDKMREIHFYIMLDTFYNGGVLCPEILKFITDPSEFVVGAKVPKVDHYFYDKKGEPYDFSKIRAGFIYISRDEKKPYVPIKAVTRKSFASLFRGINQVRTAVKNNGPWTATPSSYKCWKICTKNPMEECLSEEEKRIAFGSEFIKKYLENKEKRLAEAQ